MIRPSPNEFERLKNEEFIKRRILRLKEVRECSKVNASRLRHLYKEQKTKVINKIAENIQEQINIEDDKRLTNLKSKYERQQNAMGIAHSNAADWIDPAIFIQEKSETNHVVAQERHEVALNQLKIDKEDRDYVKNARLDAQNLAMEIEKERAVAIASLPPPPPPLFSQDMLKDVEDNTPRVRVCDRNKFSVIESFETRSYNVERVVNDSHRYNAKDAGEIHQEHRSQLDTNLHMESEEQAIKAQLRGHHAIKKQTVQKDYGELITNLEHISKGEMAKRQREYHKNELVGPNSAGHLGLGHMAAMTGYKERCRERAVESAVMESLKDITNNTSSQQQYTVVDESVTRGETKLSKLYDIIKRQKENVSLENGECETIQTEKNDVEAVGDEEVRAIVSVEEDDTVTAFPPTNDDIPNDILAKAAAAAIKSKSVLEKSFCEKERNTIERKIQRIDWRLERIKETDVQNEGGSRRDSPRAASSEPGCVHNPLSMDGSNESSVALSEESACSNSLNIIREFQRQALLKLSGQPIATIGTLNSYGMERHLSELSLGSVSISEHSWINNEVGTTGTPQENMSEVSESYSLVTDWMITQPTGCIDRIPDWVTNRGAEQQFMPDLNTSFMSSILNIRSETGLSRDDTLSSCSTVLTHSSVLRQMRQSSYTEISNVESVVDAQTPRLPVIANICDQSLSVTDLSDQFERSCLLARVRDCPSAMERVVDTDQQADLIDFRSTEDLLRNQDPVSDEENSYMRALSELITIVATSNYDSMSDVESLDGESRVQSRNETGLPKIDIVESFSERQTNSTNDPDQSRVDKNLISDYESFLSGLINKPLMSHTTSDDTSRRLTSGDDRGLNGSSSVHVSCDENVGALSQPVLDFHRDSSPISDKFIEDTLCNISDDPREYANITSTTKENGVNSMDAWSQDQGSAFADMPQLSTSLLVPGLLSERSLKQLSLYSSDTDDNILSNNEMKPLSSRSSDEFSLEFERGVKFNKKKVKKLLSSTMKPGRQHVKTMSPDISSISSISAEACKQLKQKIMDEYFEKNKDLIMSVLSGTKSSDLSMKPLESTDDSTPRITDSGKPSSRLTAENSELNTDRLTNEDFFMTPRTENNWTDYSPRDEWSMPHSNFQTLSNYNSSEDSANKVLGEENRNIVEKEVDLDETLKNDDEVRERVSSSESINLINLHSILDIRQYKDVVNDFTSFSLSNGSPTPSCNEKMQQDYVPSEESTSDCNSSSFKILGSYHSSSDSGSIPPRNEDTRELEESLPFSVATDHSVYPRSDPDTSSLSLASFLKNESMCYQLIETPHKEEASKSSTGNDRCIDSSDEMKKQLAQWKKDRLSRINQNPPVVRITSTNTTKTGTIRKQDEVEKRSRTIKLYNNLEEVQKKKQLKEAEQRKMDNQMKKKEYAEKVRRLRKDGREASKY